MTLQLMIPLDGSHFAEQAIPYAIELTSHTHATIHLVKVHQPLDEEQLGDARFIAATHLDEELRDEDRRYLAKVAAIPELAACNPVTALLSGTVVSALHKYIRS